MLATRKSLLVYQEYDAKYADEDSNLVGNYGG